MGGFPAGLGAVAPLHVILEISPGCRGWFLVACLGMLKGGRAGALSVQGRAGCIWGLDCFSSEERMVFNEHKAHDIMLLQITTIHS